MLFPINKKWDETGWTYVKVWQNKICLTKCNSWSVVTSFNIIIYQFTKKNEENHWYDLHVCTALVFYVYVSDEVHNLIDIKPLQQQIHFKISWTTILFQNSLLSALPYLVMWLLNLVMSPAADKLIDKKVLSVERSRKLFNSIGKNISHNNLIWLGILWDDLKLIHSILTLIKKFLRSQNTGNYDYSSGKNCLILG